MGKVIPRIPNNGILRSNLLNSWEIDPLRCSPLICLDVRQASPNQDSVHSFLWAQNPIKEDINIPLTKMHMVGMIDQTKTHHLHLLNDGPLHACQRLHCGGYLSPVQMLRVQMENMKGMLRDEPGDFLKF
jgi:hypothetical protein